MSKLIERLIQFMACLDYEGLNYDEGEAREALEPVAQLEAENERFRELLSKHHEMDESRTWFWDDDIVKALGGE